MFTIISTYRRHIEYFNHSVGNTFILHLLMCILLMLLTWIFIQAVGSTATHCISVSAERKGSRRILMLDV